MTFENADFDALAAQWKGFYPERYRVGADLLRFNTVDCPIFDWGTSSIMCDGGKPIGFATLKRSASPTLFKGADPDQAHLSAIAFNEPAVGVDLLAKAKQVLRNRGVYRLVFGQDCRHFFPGCPEDFPALRDFLRIEGFEDVASSFDLERDLSSYEPPAGCHFDHEGVEFRRLGAEDRLPLGKFLGREFPGRWLFDTLSKIQLEGREDFVLGMFVQGALEGFAVTQDFSHRAPVAGAVWKEDLGESWGALGPIGVSKKVRGRGLGDALLGYGLSDLRRRGVRRCIIDWTALEHYYGRHGFQITRRYSAMALRLDP